MKQSGITIIFVIVCVAVLFAAYGIGLCIREVRFRAAGTAPKPTGKPQMSVKTPEPGDTREPARKPAEVVQVPREMRTMPGREARPGQGQGGPREGMAMFQMLPPEEAAELRERWPNMSDEEREQFTAQMRERWDNMSEEERAQALERRRVEMEEARARFQNMSEEEREKFGAEMRGRFGGRQGGGQGGGQGRRPGRVQRQSD